MHFMANVDKYGRNVNLDMDCELDHMNSLHHNGNIDNFLNQQSVRYCDHHIIQKFSHKDIESFSIGTPTVAIKQYDSVTSKYLYTFKKYGKIDY